MTFIVALTGGIGSGKSTVADMFAQLGVPVVDADLVARQVVEPGTPALAAICEHFGTEILQADNRLNRALLRQRIFSQPAEKSWLNQLLHPLIHQECQRLLHTVDSLYALWVVPLLIENKLTPLADRILVVDVSREVQITRTILRDKLSSEQAESILAAQVSREERLSYADDIIDNNSEESQLASQIKRLDENYRRLAHAKAGFGNEKSRTKI